MPESVTCAEAITSTPLTGSNVVPELNATVPPFTTLLHERVSPVSPVTTGATTARWPGRTTWVSISAITGGALTTSNVPAPRKRPFSSPRTIALIITS